MAHSTSGNLPKITNIVVLMLENRSYDNILGALYLNETPHAGQTLNGLTGCETNTSTSYGAIQVDSATEAVPYPSDTAFSAPVTAIPLWILVKYLGIWRNRLPVTTPPH